LLVVLLGVWAGGAIRGQWLGLAEDWYYDLWHQLSGCRYAPRQVVIAAIDDQTRLEHQDEPLVFWSPYFARAVAFSRQAGARSAMVSLWNIPVDESLKFYAAFYKALKEGKPKSEALKIARQVVRSREPHPYFWSGLILHGEG